MEQKVSTLLKVSLDSIKDMIDVNTIIVDKVIINNNISIIPVSRVRMGFLSGGGDLKSGEEPPFTGGSGSTMSITPIGFLVCNNEEVTFINAGNNNSSEKIIEVISSLIKKLEVYFKKKDIDKLDK